MTTPGTMQKIIERLRKQADEAATDEAKEMARDPDSYNTGYAMGYANALKAVLSDITGE